LYIPFRNTSRGCCNTKNHTRLSISRFICASELAHWPEGCTYRCVHRIACSINCEEYMERRLLGSCRSITCLSGWVELGLGANPCQHKSVKVNGIELFLQVKRLAHPHRRHRQHLKHMRTQLRHGISVKHIQWIIMQIWSITVRNLWCQYPARQELSQIQHNRALCSSNHVGDLYETLPSFSTTNTLWPDTHGGCKNVGSGDEKPNFLYRLGFS
jgi:hypothetical protein